MELEKLTALQLGEKIKQRQVSVLDGVKTVFEQIEKQDSEVHAYLDTYKEEAYKRAEEVQKGIEDGTYTSPLAGVPIAIKDNITASPETHGIWNMYQAVLQVVPVQQWQQEKLIWHLVQIQADLSVSQVPTVV